MHNISPKGTQGWQTKSTKVKALHRKAHAKINTQAFPPVMIVWSHKTGHSQKKNHNKKLFFPLLGGKNKFLPNIHCFQALQNIRILKFFVLNQYAVENLCHKSCAKFCVPFVRFFKDIR